MQIALKKISRQVIVITGATSGLGLVTARRAAARGARLVLAARNEIALKQLAAELTGRGTEVAYVVADVGDPSQMQAVAQCALERFGGFDTWINNAGVSIYGRIDDVPLADQKRLFETNFWGVVNGSLAALEHLRQRGGALINVGSELSDFAAPLRAIYSASKHAVKGYTDALRLEVEASGAPVSVTLVKPAALNTQYVPHARNYLEVEPRLAPPVYAPELAADAILFAAQNPRRDVFVGGAAKLASASARFAPRTTDWLLKKTMFWLQRTSQPARERDDGLHGTSSALLERDRADWRVHEHCAYTWSSLHPRTTTAILLTLVVMGGYWLMQRPARAWR